MIWFTANGCWPWSGVAEDGVRELIRPVLPITKVRRIASLEQRTANLLDRAHDIVADAEEPGIVELKV